MSTSTALTTSTAMLAPSPSYRVLAPASPPVLTAAPVTAARLARATYLRRRIVAAIAVLVVALGLVLTGGAIMAEAGGVTPASAGHVVVQPGQTLWDVAQAHAPAGADLRGFLRDLAQFNGVRADAVKAWDVLLLPVVR